MKSKQTNTKAKTSKHRNTPHNFTKGHSFWTVSHDTVLLLQSLFERGTRSVSARRRNKNAILIINLLQNSIEFEEANLY